MADYEMIQVYQRDFSSKALLSVVESDLEREISKLLSSNQYREAILLMKRYPDTERFMFQLGNS